jgi:hypothetical protein
MGNVSSSDGRERLMYNKEYTEFIFKAMTPVFKAILSEKIKDYEPEFVKKEEYRENGKLKGLFIYFICDGVVWILETQNISKNKFFFVKHFRKIFKDKSINVVKVMVQKLNKKVFKFYIKLGFKIIEENGFNACLEYIRIDNVRD